MQAVFEVGRWRTCHPPAIEPEIVDSEAIEA